MVRGTALPIEIREAQIIVESGCSPTLSELDDLPEELVEKIIMYKSIKSAKLASD